MSSVQCNNEIKIQHKFVLITKYINTSELTATKSVLTFNDNTVKSKFEYIFPYKQITYY